MRHNALSLAFLPIEFGLNLSRGTFYRTSERLWGDEYHANKHGWLYWLLRLNEVFYRDRTYVHT